VLLISYKPRDYGREWCQEANGPEPRRSPLCLFFLQI
jgi:hypothetical protein